MQARSGAGRRRGAGGMVFDSLCNITGKDPNNFYKVGKITHKIR